VNDFIRGGGVLFMNERSIENGTLTGDQLFQSCRGAVSGASAFDVLKSLLVWQDVDEPKL
jgi:hypothetical protein